MLPTQGARVQSLAGELDSLVLQLSLQAMTKVAQVTTKNRRSQISQLILKNKLNVTQKFSVLLS